MAEFKGVGISFRPEFGTFWQDIYSEIDCIEYVPDELPENTDLKNLTIAAIGSKPTMAHFTSLSVASPDRLDLGRLEMLRLAVDEVGADCISDHLSFRRCEELEIENFCLPIDSVPGIEIIQENVKAYCKKFSKEMFLENITINGYYGGVDPIEAELALVHALSSCGVKILFDVNNCFINCRNFGVDIERYLARFPLDSIAGLHIAGHEESDGWLVDSHMSSISSEVKNLALNVMRRSSAQFIVLERDNASASRDEILTEVMQLRSIWDQSKFG